MTGTADVSGTGRQCASCGNPLPARRAGPAAEYCSNACRQRAYRRRTALAQDPVGTHASAGDTGRGYPLRSNLDGFVGREPDLADVARRLRRHRRVTLVGPPGVGKSRLAVELARRTRNAYPGGMWHVDLDEVPDPGRLGADLAGLLDDPHRDGPPALLLLDNCEEARDAVAELIRDASRRWPRARLLLTSREPVRPADEVLQVSPLPVAGPDERDPLGSAAVRLFVDRAVNPSLRVDGNTEDDIVRLCHRVDGLPLALEFAARATGFFTPGEILDRLDSGIDLLDVPSRTAPERHHGLRAAIERSYRRLDPRERAVFGRLSVLGTEFELRDATPVCAGGEVPATAVPGLLAQLAEKSLIIADGKGYRQLNVLREFGRAILAAGPEEADVRDRWVAVLADKAGERHPAARCEILAEACAWAARRPGPWHVPLAVAFARALREHGVVRRTDHELVLAARDRVPPGSPWAAPLLLECAALAGWVGDHTDALSYALAAMAAVRVPDWPGLTRRALAELGAAHSAVGEVDRADRCLRDGSALSRTLGQAGACRYGLAGDALARGDEERAAASAAVAAVDLPDRSELAARALAEVGAGYSAVGEVDRADRYLRDGLALSRTLDQTGQVGACLYRLAGNALARGDEDRAAALVAEALPPLRAAGPRPLLLLCLHLAGQAALVQGDVERAWASFTEGLDVAAGAEYRWAAGLMLEGLAVESVLRGALARGLYLGGVAARFRLPTPLPASGWDELVASALGYARGGLDAQDVRRVRAAAERATDRDLAAWLRQRDVPGDDFALAPLTDRERAVLALVARGLTNTQIAGRLRISQRAVAYRLTSAGRKLGLRSRPELAAWAWRNAHSGAATGTRAGRALSAE